MEEQVLAQPELKPEATTEEGGNGAAKEVVDESTVETSYSQSDVDRRVTQGVNTAIKNVEEKYDSIIKELERKTMSEKEKEQVDKVEKDQELARLKVSENRTNFFMTNEIPIARWGFVHGSNQDEMRTNYDNLLALISSEIKEDREKYRATETGTPSGGSVGGSIEQIDPKDISLVSAKYRQLEKDKGKDEARRWLESIKIKR